MELKELRFRALLAQYHVQRSEQMAFTNLFLLAILAVPVAWIVNHVLNFYTIGWMLAVVAVCFGLAMAGHCHNSLIEIRAITERINSIIDVPEFNYDLGRSNDPVRVWLTTPFKVIGAVLAIWAMFKWPQL